MLESPCNPYPLAVFRVLFFLGLLLHFGPSLLDPEGAYGARAFVDGSLRNSQFRAWLGLPSVVHWVATLAVFGALTAGMLGFRPRLCALFAGLGCYLFNELNSLWTSTLALELVWMVCIVWFVGGGGAEALAVGARTRPSTWYVRVLVAIHLWSAVFWSALEKLRSDWGTGSTLSVMLDYPRSYYLRDWLVDVGVGVKGLGTALSLATVALEFALPLLLISSRTRPFALAGLLAFFASIGLALEVPPLFVCLYLGACALVSRDGWWPEIPVPRAAT